MMAPAERASSIPNRLRRNHVSKLWSSVRARVSATSPALRRPGSLLMRIFPSGVFSFSSMTSCSTVRPVTSSIRSMTMPSTSRPKEAPTAESRSGNREVAWLCASVRMRGLLRDEAGAPGDLGDPKADELPWSQRCHPDLADDLARGDPLGRVRLPVTPDEERRIRGGPGQGALTPLLDEEGADRTADGGPQPLVVGLEDDPLRARDDRLFEVADQSPDGEVAPVRVGGQRAGSPHPDAAAGEFADAVDPHRVEELGLGRSEPGLQLECSLDDPVGRCLMDAAGAVPDPCDVPAGRNSACRAGRRVEH